MANAPSASFRDLIKAFTQIGLTSFGGPAGQIALMHKEIVEDRKWITEADYLNALNVCHLLPGPEAQQLATWMGWRLYGIKGGLAAGLLFVIPGALVVLGLSILYAFASNLHWFDALFLGIKAAVLAIVVQALIRIGKRSLNSTVKRVLALAAFAALFFLNLPFPLVVLSAGCIGYVMASAMPQGAAETAVVAESPRLSKQDMFVAAKTVAVWLTIWALPMAATFALLGPDHILWKIGEFFSQLAVVTFGGAYAVLAYMAQEAVQSFGWLQAREMADGLGLAETTPGPLILVTQFVGFLAAYRSPEPFSPLLAGLLGAGLTTWVTFAPCFLWIFTLAPWISRLQQAPRLTGALAAITATVVGVIANLSLWFALHVLFEQVDEKQIGPVRLYVSDAASFNWQAAVLAATAAFLLFDRKLNVPITLAISALGGLGLAAVS